MTEKQEKSVQCGMKMRGSARSQQLTDFLYTHIHILGKNIKKRISKNKKNPPGHINIMGTPVLRGQEKYCTCRNQFINSKHEKVQGTVIKIKVFYWKRGTPRAHCQFMLEFSTLIAVG